MSQFVRGFGANNELLAAWTNTDSSIPTQEIVFVPAAGTQAFAIVGNEQDFASTYSAVDVADESGRALPAHLRKGGLKTDSASSPVSIVSTASLSSRASTAEDAQSTISSSYGSGLYQSESDSLSPRSLHVPSPWSKTLAWQSHAKVPADDALSIASGEMRDTFRNPWKRVPPIQSARPRYRVIPVSQEPESYDLWRTQPFELFQGRHKASGLPCDDMYETTLQRRSESCSMLPWAALTSEAFVSTLSSMAVYFSTRFSSTMHVGVAIATGTPRTSSAKHVFMEDEGPVDGQEHVGGRNIDYALLKHFATEFKDKYKIDVLSNPKAMFRLAAGCDRVTKVLSLQAFEAAETQAFWLRCDGTYNHHPGPHLGFQNGPSL
ncbi:hypothetical protein L226DRAFT_527718 [Lentinus tigrinus ALCF2SS1-7]|uniref:uncharacterized protein n=1 Tax=Lentinus tigrinus ALCF2SS1-7 TaxID=1328758 RepID=UPI001166383C|nr:hypothetical protein L226DRAFT_527718 [Lentinus tigrinus ALCF2SS1-7]